MNNNSELNGEVLGSVNGTTNGNSVQPQPMMQPQMHPQGETLNNNVVMDNSFLTNNNLNNNVNSNINNVDNLNNSTLNNNLNANMNNGVMQPENLNTEPSQVMPPPASAPAMDSTYPNSQNVNAMPGFENSSVIGTTPPVSLEPEKQPPKKKQNKTLFVVIIIVVLFGIGFGVYYILQYTDILNNTPQIVINTNDLEVNMGDELSTTITDYATITGTDIKNCSVSTVNVDKDIPGEYTYQVTCGEIIKTGKITVVDNRDLEVETQKVYKVKGDTVEAKEFIKNPVAGYTYEFVDASIVNTYLASDNGTYNVKIKATSGTKTKEVEAELVIQQYGIRGYITCSSKEQNITSDSAIMTVQEKFALLDDGNSGFGGIASEIHAFKFTDETKYADYLAKYNTDGSITINNITGDVKFDDENLTIMITNERSVDDVKNEYGENNLINYGSIKTYFEVTLGYICKYDVNSN